MVEKKQAVAINYDKDQQSGAPKVVAVGEGHIAQEIIRRAKLHGVPVVEDMEVVGKLVRLPPETEIPSQLYAAVAKILAFIYSLEDEQQAIKGKLRK